MLFTRCPDCDTTFRITDEALKKANGQVRCGRCASVFNAYAELHDPTAKSFEAQGAGESARKPPPATAAVAPTAATPPTPVATHVDSTATTPSPASAHSNEPASPSDESAAAESIGAHSVADIVAEVELAAAEVGALDDSDDVKVDRELIGPTEIDRVLTAEGSVPARQHTESWTLLDEPEPERTQRVWGAAVGFALLVLVLQIVHHYRADIAGHPTFGPWIQGTYSAFGAELTPHWNVRQYEILDWIATAEPNARGVGSLKITARIQNRGPLRQPYPAVQLKLKDRWEDAVGSRMFSPAEYLPSGTPRGRLMSPGETARAEIELVDPGPDAYGFELDVCIEVEASLVTCGGDEVFL